MNTKNISFLTFLIFINFSIYSFGSSLKDWNQELIKEALDKEFHPYPAYGDPYWNQIPDSIKKPYIANAEKHLHTSWQSLPATLFMEFALTGNRNNYQTVYFEKRNKLNALVMGEILENKGRFLSDIVNGIWSLCEETWWGLPAHYPTSLPSPDNQVVAIYESQAAGDLAWMQYMFKDSLEKISPLLNKRIKSELQRRIITPCRKNQYEWMSVANNWNSWICSNWIAVVLLSDMPLEEKASDLQHIFQVLNTFYSNYPDDGGCEEGPGYWANAGGALFDCIQLISMATKGKLTLAHEEKFNNIGNFIYKIYMGNKHFINFGDASATTSLHPGIVYNFGRFIDSKQLQSFSTIRRDELIHDNKPIATGKGESLGRFLYTLTNIHGLLQQGSDNIYSLTEYLPDSEVFVARSDKQNNSGLSFTVKGGHNNQSHNHNDVGNYIVYADGNPLIIDVGPEAYTKQTFSKDRYKIWTTRSSYHNTPIINNAEQAPGASYKARDLKTFISSEENGFSLDISSAYPSEANVKEWNRSIKLRNKKQQIHFEERYILNKLIASPEIILMTAATPTVAYDGKIILRLKNQEYIIHYDKKQLSATIEPIQLTDSGLSKIWNNNIFRIHLKVKSKKLQQQINYTLSKL